MSYYIYTTLVYHFEKLFSSVCFESVKVIILITPPYSANQNITMLARIYNIIICIVCVKVSREKSFAVLWFYDNRKSFPMNYLYFVT